MSLASKLKNFYFNLSIKEVLPPGTEVMNPYESPDVHEVCARFLNAFYDDENPRKIILGINPGRFGAGITGITFTDPVRLEEACGITNPFPKKQELSSVFIYDMVDAYGGTPTFFKQYFLSAVSPLGFTRDGKNLNYYDDKRLQEALIPFILGSLTRHIEMGFSRDEVVCLGEGKNFNYLVQLNREHKLFRKIIPLPHPRWIMQYRYHSRKEYIRKYLDVLKKG